MFVSDAYEGAISEREIVIKSGFLDYIEAGDFFTPIVHTPRARRKSFNPMMLSPFRSSILLTVADMAKMLDLSL